QTKAATSKNSLPGKETPTAQKRDCVRLVIWKRYALFMLHTYFGYYFKQISLYIITLHENIFRC
ncbi:hypothetical protein, partial [Chitinophaga sp. CF118]|uniref:hypothetical protein n=1 Tax=Chitinophaga sp. CF118 TaxID=1884367 RepID=UPI001C432D4C